MTHKEAIAYYKQQAENVAKSHGIDSDYFIHAHSMLIAVEAGASVTEARTFATNQLSSIKRFRLLHVNKDNWS